MGALVGNGFGAVIGLFLGFIFMIIGLFAGHIILFDSILLAIISGILCNQLWGVHPAFCLLIGIAVLILLFKLQTTTVGFWVIGLLLSAFWALIFGFLAYFISSEDIIWFFVITGLGFAMMIGLHLKARNM